jgi:hypothetical protein
MGSYEEDTYPENLYMFLKFWREEQMPEILAEEFAGFDEEQVPAIEKALKHYRYYFPDHYIPSIYTFFSSLGYSVVTMDSVVGIGLDKYLGKDYYDLYDKVGWSAYQKRRMHKEMIPVDLMRSMAESDFPYEMKDSDNLLDHMVYEGKVQFYLNCMLPAVADTLKWRYTGKQWSWANRHERRIWNYIAEKQLLFTTEKIEIRKFVGDGPYTTIFSDISAPRAGSFVGFKIIESFMENNDHYSLHDLMVETDARKILAGAKYNP